MEPLPCLEKSLLGGEETQERMGRLRLASSPAELQLLSDSVKVIEKDSSIAVASTPRPEGLKGTLRA